MTEKRFYMVPETGTVYSLEEIEEIFIAWKSETGFPGDFEEYWDTYCSDLEEVRPIVDDPDDSDSNDWELL